MAELRSRQTASGSEATRKGSDAAQPPAGDADLSEEELLAIAAADSAPMALPLGSGSLRLLPLLVFLALFFAISFASTGTMHYGVLNHRPVVNGFNRAKIYMQEMAGLRTPRKRPNPEANTGYGGVTKKKPAAAAAAASTSGGMPVMDITDELLVITPPVPRDPKALYLTNADLANYIGADDEPIFLAVHGRIFDVTTGRIHYGPGADYSNLVGKEVSRAFATNCFDNANLWDQRGLTNDQRRAIDGWYKFYLNHHTYRAVGWVILPEIAPDAPLPVDTC